jgi:hypothetical protein
MKRITLILGIVAVMVAMLVALAAPAMAKDNDGNKGGGNKANSAKNDGNHNNGNRNNGINRLDNQLDRIDNRVDNQLDRLDNRLDNRVDLDNENFLVSDVDFSPVFTTNEGLADDLCSPLSAEVLNNAIPGCIFGDRNVDPNIGFVRDIDNVDFVDVDRDIGFANGNNHNGNAHHSDNGNGNGHHNGGGGQKGNGK